MKKFFWLMATVLISSMSLISCGDDDDNNSTTPKQPQGSSTYDITASAVFDKAMAKYGYMEVSYDYNGKTETFQLKDGDASDKLPTANDFATKMLQTFSQVEVKYTSDNFIIRNVTLKNVDNKVDVVFKSKFVLYPDHPSVDSDESINMATPVVIGYAEADGSVIEYHTNILFHIGIRPNKFEDFLQSQAKREYTTTFTRGN